MKNRLPLYQYSDAKKGIEKSDLYKSYIVSQKPLMSDFMMLKTQEEEQQDDFVRFEEELAAFLGGLFVQRTEIEKQELLNIVRSEQFDIETFNAVLAQVNEATLVDQEERQGLREFLDDVMQKSHLEALDFAQSLDLVSEVPSDTNASLVPGVQTFKGQMEDFTEYYANNYGERILGVAIAAKALKFDQGQVPIEEMEKFITDKFEENPYWGNVANTITTKSYHYSYLKSLQESGLTTYTYKAIIDENTTEICRHLNGRVFNVSTGVQLLENYASANPNSAPQELPWLNKQEQEDIVNQNLTEEQLQAQGVILPGTLHANCRSTLISNRGERINAQRSIF